MKPIRDLRPADIIDFLRKVDKGAWTKIGASGIVIILFSFFVVWPAWFKRSNVRGEIQSLETQIGTLETLARKKNEWVSNKERYLQLIHEAKDKLHRHGEASLLLGSISRLAKETSVKIVSSTPQEVTEKFPSPFDSLYEASLYDFTVEGGYHGLGHFIGRIESNPKLLRIQLFNLKPKDDAPKIQWADISLSAVSFKKDPEDVAVSKA